MDTTALFWLCIGAGAMLVLLAVLRLLRPAADSRERFQVEDDRAPPPPCGEIPYHVDRRPLPTSDDPEVLLPRQVGPYERRELRVPPNLGDPIYAKYYRGTAMVFVELGICGNADVAQRGVVTARRETMHDGDHMVLQAWSNGTDPSYLKVKDSRAGGAFVAWARGGYYFSAHAKGGQSDLDAFMEAFPY